STRPDWLDAAAFAPPENLRSQGAITDVDVRALLEDPHRLVIFALWPAVSVPAYRHRDGCVFLAHRALSTSWSAEIAASIAADCDEVQPLSPHDAAKSLQPIIERLQARGTAVAVCTVFRHVHEPFEHKRRNGDLSLRELARRTNLEVARLSLRTGCFVLDFDRPLAQEGGASLQADCFGGDGRAAEIALDEFVALIMDALPADLPSQENV
ncbi:MAG TPA: hypothetical protein VIJ37_00685, partial [Steroidobacteraceae bacterium]